MLIYNQFLVTRIVQERSQDFLGLFSWRCFQKFAILSPNSAVHYISNTTLLRKVCVCVGGGQTILWSPLSKCQCHSFQHQWFSVVLDLFGNGDMSIYIRVEVDDKSITTLSPRSCFSCELFKVK